MSEEITRYDINIEWGSMCECEVVYVSDGEYVRYADYSTLREQLAAMTRERDSARRILDATAEAVGFAKTYNALAIPSYAEHFRYRAERMARVLAAAEDFISYQGTAQEPRYYDALVAEVTMERLALAGDGKVRALDTTGLKITEAMVNAAFVRLYPGCEPDEMQHYHAADIRDALTAALTAASEVQP